MQIVMTHDHLIHIAFILDAGQSWFLFTPGEPCDGPCPLNKAIINKAMIQKCRMQLIWKA